MYKNALCIAALAVVLVPSGRAYSVLTHEAIIDSAWDDNIKPLLIQRFPGATADDLLKAHAFAYGGCIIQDMGYYPFGSKFFSDLTHYVRAGDFVMNLVKESQDLDEYAFALGAVAHYAADNEGHPLAVNPSVPVEYPKLMRRYGKKVTYEEDPKAHMRVEFSFDVLQVARGHYAPKSYHDFIGFEVAKPVLERAFFDTYSLELKDIFKSLDLALGTYRRGVSTVIPEMTKTAWSMKKDELMKGQSGVTRKQFVYNLSRASYEKEWDGEYERPGIGARVLGFVLRILPKVGPFKALSFKPPTPQVTAYFENSFNQTLTLYRRLLGEVGAGKPHLANLNFDTGQPTEPTRYEMADEAFAKLAVKLAGKDNVDPSVRDAVLAYFRDPELPYANKKDAKNWRETMDAIQKLKAPLTAEK